MPSTDLSDYPHLKFQRCWKITQDIALNLGRCTALIECLESLPFEPNVQTQFRQVAFERGAQATTAIEGNTLSDEELRQVLDGKPLPASRRYQAAEVTNVLEAMNALWKQVVQEGAKAPVSAKLLCQFNKQVGSNLGALYDGVPGRFRNDRRSVARYLAPPHEQVPELIDALCQWLQSEFGFHRGDQSMDTAIVQAIVAHVFFEWIHPFADGNGQTGRLLEFYILLRSGLPDITSHVLANHYNQTRAEYTAHFDNARKKRDLTEFLRYSIQGFTDGLRSTIDESHGYLMQIVWRELIYKAFRNYTDYRKKSVFVRRRDLALAMPLGKNFTSLELVRTSDELAGLYMSHDPRTLAADFNAIEKLDLVVRNEDGTYRANTAQLLAGHIVPRAARANG